MNKTLLLPLLLLLGGCVSIQDNVQVDKPTETNSAVNITQKCPVQPYPVRVIRADGPTAVPGLQGTNTIRTQTDFANLFNALVVNPSEVNYPTVQGTNLPVVDFTNQQVLFIPLGELNSSCQKIVPVRAETDCISVTFWLSRLNLSKDCQNAVTHPVLVYVMPKTDLPLSIQWSDDADGDGISNDSEIKLGTDPLDPKSHP